MRLPVSARSKATLSSLSPPSTDRVARPRVGWGRRWIYLRVQAWPVAGHALLAVLLALAANPRPVPAQGAIVVIPVQGLRFGVIAPGAPTVVSPLDAGGRAVLELVGSGRVTLHFQLPPALGASGEARLVVRFGPGDGRITFPGSSRVLEFDPRLPLALEIPAGSGGVTVFLGGTVVPARGQAPDSYDGGITVEVLSGNPPG
jgi:hypothetical protein